MAQAFAALIVCLCLSLTANAAQVKTDAKKTVRPTWSELKPDHQKILAPLSSDWENMDATRRKKWVAIAERYPKMKPQEQQRLQKNMAAWARLTPEERRAAREKYQNLKKLPPDKRKEVTTQWQRYQNSLAASPAPDPLPPPDAQEAPAAQ
jgi:Protein of unknown function (DUF3106)